MSAVSWGPDRIDVFAASRAPGNPLEHWWSDGGAFVWTRVARRQPCRRNGERGLACRQSARRLRYLRDQRIAHWQWDGQRWNGPVFRGDDIPAGDVSAVVRAPHRLDVFVAGAGNTLRQWPGGGLENATTQPWSNWPTNHETNPVVGTCGPRAWRSS